VDQNRTMTPIARTEQKRALERSTVSVPVRLTWKDQRGTTRFASVMARNVSDTGIYVECQSPVTIPLYRLVQLQVEREDRSLARLPTALREGRVLSAVYRINPRTSAHPQGLALRLMIEPRVPAAELNDRRATA
jgi:hypothetical protein